MTKQEIDAVFERVRSWPHDRQADLISIVKEMERQGQEPYELSEEERADLREAIAEADRGEFATDEEVAALFAAALLLKEGDDPAIYHLSDEERSEIRAGIAEADRGDFASVERMQAILSPRP